MQYDENQTWLTQVGVENLVRPRRRVENVLKNTQLFGRWREVSRLPSTSTTMARFLLRFTQPYLHGFYDATRNTHSK